MSACGDRRHRLQGPLSFAERERGNSRVSSLYAGTRRRAKSTGMGGVSSLCERTSFLLEEIAERFGRSVKTVTTQRRSAMRKLGLESEAELIEFCRQLGLV